jgi:beta-phosphoglucomutase-like phosphatase (HAD superfamily)
LKDKAGGGAHLYIEDAPANVRALRADGHATIVFANSTNVGLHDPRAETWADVERLVLDENARWLAKRESKHVAGG